jgi:methionine-S-sulfoxide reductase
MRYLTILRTIILIALTGSTAMAMNSAPSPQTALFAGGCFWCMQPAFDNTPGVVSTSVGYTGGDAKTANYDAVSSGTTNHVEAIQVTYDPAKVKYEALVETYWENIDPTDAGGQFADRGTQYHTAIFYADEAQKAAAEKSKAAIAAKFAPKPIVVNILPAKPFYAAEDYHQKYYQKNSLHYNAYKHGSGRASYLEDTWGK